jgi:hypothetical protein
MLWPMLVIHPRMKIALVISTHFYLTRQDVHTMLDYAKIGLKRWPDDQRNKDTVVFLQSCSYLPKLTAFVLTRSRHVQ